ncbi:hypothetical protein SVAN01_11150 [Stagonosporopsis vannaccii]|nr:hypothetical protein SVAN01_11150 [Stagonosporopsis vannaccii]
MTKSIIFLDNDSQPQHAPLEPTINQAPRQLSDSSTVSTAYLNSTMAATATPSSPLSAAPDSPLMAAKTSPRVSHLQMTATILDELSAEAGSDNPLTISISPSKESAANTPVASKGTTSERSPKRSPKRSLEEDKKEGKMLPVPKKLATKEETAAEVSDQISPTELDSLNEATTGGNDEGSYETTEPRKLRKQSTITPKKAVVKLNRSRVCAECKRRKVKCRHSASEQATRGAENASTSLRLLDLTDERGTRSKPTEADNGVESTMSQLPVSLQKIASADNDDTVAKAQAPNKANNKKNAAPKIAGAPPERTSTRSRKAPQRFEDLHKQSTPKPLSLKKPSSKVFDPVYVTTNSTSRLGKADMYHMLTNNDTAWTNLSFEQQATLVSMLPDTAETQQLLAKIQAGETVDTRPQYLRASNVFRAEVAKFQADLTNGHLAKTWQVAAGQAVAERAAGAYDAWKAEEAELWWGQKSK